MNNLASAWGFGGGGEEDKQEQTSVHPQGSEETERQDSGGEKGDEQKKEDEGMGEGAAAVGALWGFGGEAGPAEEEGDGGDHADAEDSGGQEEADKERDEKVDEGENAPGGDKLEKKKPSPSEEKPEGGLAAAWGFAGGDEGTSSPQETGGEGDAEGDGADENRNEGQQKGNEDSPSAQGEGEEGREEEKADEKAEDGEKTEEKTDGLMAAFGFAPPEGEGQEGDKNLAQEGVEDSKESSGEAEGNPEEASPEEEGKQPEDGGVPQEGQGENTHDPPIEEGEGVSEEQKGEEDNKESAGENEGERDGQEEGGDGDNEGTVEFGFFSAVAGEEGGKNAEGPPDTQAAEGEPSGEKAEDVQSPFLQAAAGEETEKEAEEQGLQSGEKEQGGGAEGQEDPNGEGTPQGQEGDPTEQKDMNGTSATPQEGGGEQAEGKKEDDNGDGEKQSGDQTEEENAGETDASGQPQELEGAQPKERDDFFTSKDDLPESGDPCTAFLKVEKKSPPFSLVGDQMKSSSEQRRAVWGAFAVAVCALSESQTPELLKGLALCSHGVDETSEHVFFEFSVYKDEAFGLFTLETQMTPEAAVNRLAETVQSLSGDFSEYAQLSSIVLERGADGPPLAAGGGVPEGETEEERKEREERERMAEQVAEKQAEAVAEAEESNEDDMNKDQGETLRGAADEQEQKEKKYETPSDHEGQPSPAVAEGEEGKSVQKTDSPVLLSVTVVSIKGVVADPSSGIQAGGDVFLAFRAKTGGSNIRPGTSHFIRMGDELMTGQQKDINKTVGLQTPPSSDESRGGDNQSERSGSPRSSANSSSRVFQIGLFDRTSNKCIALGSLEEQAFPLSAVPGSGSCGPMDLPLMTVEAGRKQPNGAAIVVLHVGEVNQHPEGGSGVSPTPLGAQGKETAEKSQSDTNKGEEGAEGPREKEEEYEGGSDDPADTRYVSPKINVVPDDRPAPKTGFFGKDGKLNVEVPGGGEGNKTMKHEEEKERKTDPHNQILSESNHEEGDRKESEDAHNATRHVQLPSHIEAAGGDQDRGPTEDISPQSNMSRKSQSDVVMAADLMHMWGMNPSGTSTGQRHNWEHLKTERENQPSQQQQQKDAAASSQKGEAETFDWEAAIASNIRTSKWMAPESYATYLGIDIKEKHREIFRLLRPILACDLPPPWTARRAPSGDAIFFFHSGLVQSQWQHPLEDFFVLLAETLATHCTRRARTPPRRGSAAQQLEAKRPMSPGFELVVDNRGLHGSLKNLLASLQEPSNVREHYGVWTGPFVEQHRQGGGRPREYFSAVSRGQQSPDSKARWDHPVRSISTDLAVRMSMVAHLWTQCLPSSFKFPFQSSQAYPTAKAAVASVVFVPVPQEKRHETRVPTPPQPPTSTAPPPVED